MEEHLIDWKVGEQQVNMEDIVEVIHRNNLSPQRLFGSPRQFDPKHINYLWILFDIDKSIKKLEKGLKGEIQQIGQQCHEVLAHMNERIIAMIDVSREIWILGSIFQRKCKPNGVYANDDNDDENVAQSSDNDSIATNVSRTFMFTQSPTWLLELKYMM
jgi:hypothetical protein